MARKLIPIVLLATLSACAQTGHQATPTLTTTSPSTGADTTSAASPDTGADTSQSPYSSVFSSQGQNCDAQPVQKLIGTKLTDSVTEQARTGATSNSVRILRPGEVMTMEYDPHRLNLILDKGDILAALRCG
jgi:hypothetical protein